MATSPETIQEIYKVMEDFFLASKDARESPLLKKTPMISDLPAVDSTPLEDDLLKQVADSASRSEAALFSSLSLLKSTKREASLRRKTRKDYMEDLVEYYDDEADYYNFYGNLFYQYAVGMTPTQKT